MPTVKKTHPWRKSFIRPSATAKRQPKNKPTLIAFLLDRSGSMSSCKAETISGFNAYIKELKKQDPKKQMRFTLTQFDSMGIDIVHDAAPLAKVTPLNSEIFEPRANTPLYDAIGKTITATEKAAGKKYKVLFVTLTDGLENASSEWDAQSIKTLIKDQEDHHHWTFAYIGTGINGWTSTHLLAQGTQGIGNILRTSGKNSVKAYGVLARSTAMHAASGQNVNCSATNFYCGVKTVDENEK